MSEIVGLSVIGFLVGDGMKITICCTGCGGMGITCFALPLLPALPDDLEALE